MIHLTGRESIIRGSPPEKPRKRQRLKASTIADLIDVSGNRVIPVGRMSELLLPVRYNRLFDLLQVTVNSYKIRANFARNLGGVQVAGVKQFVFDGTGLTFTTVGSLQTWNTGTITGNTHQFVFLQLQRLVTPIASIIANDELTNSDEDTEIIPLWEVPFDTGTSKIKQAEILDLRDNVSLPTMA